MKHIGQLLVVLASIVGVWAFLAHVFGNTSPAQDVAWPGIYAVPDRVVDIVDSREVLGRDAALGPSSAVEASLEMEIPSSLPQMDDLVLPRSGPPGEFDLPRTCRLPESLPPELWLRLDLPETKQDFMRRFDPPEKRERDIDYVRGPIYPSPPVRLDLGIRLWLRAPGIVFVRSPRLGISNVVLAFDDGARQRYEDLEGHEAVLAGSGEHAGKRLVTVWVKAGPNFSGDGPGYGQRFEVFREQHRPAQLLRLPLRASW